MDAVPTSEVPEAPAASSSATPSRVAGSGSLNLPRKPSVTQKEKRRSKRRPEPTYAHRRRVPDNRQGRKRRTRAITDDSEGDLAVAQKAIDVINAQLAGDAAEEVPPTPDGAAPLTPNEAVPPTPSEAAPVTPPIEAQPVESPPTTPILLHLLGGAPIGWCTDSVVHRLGGAQVRWCTGWVVHRLGGILGGGQVRWCTGWVVHRLGGVYPTGSECAAGVRRVRVLGLVACTPPNLCTT